MQPSELQVNSFTLRKTSKYHMEKFNFPRFSSYKNHNFSQDTWLWEAKHEHWELKAGLGYTEWKISK